MPSYTFNDIAQRDSLLASLTTEARSLLALDTAFQKLLPAALAKGCQAVRIRNNELVISADNSTTAARLRMMTATLLPALANKGYIASAVKVQVNVRFISPSRQKTASISAVALEGIEAARTTIRDPGISAALERLVQRHRR